MECAVCGEMVKKNSMLVVNNCTNSTNGHFIKCMANKMGEIQFDVSYVYDQ